METLNAGGEIQGVYAALLTPRSEDREVDVTALSALVRFLRSKGLSSFAANGATGEYCLTRPEQLRTILMTVREASAGEARILCGIGAAGISLSLELAAIAEEHGARGLLLPMPYFFPYEQQDLEIFCREVAKATALPILLYNLPQFTSGLHKETVRRLVREVPNILGIKDSGSSTDILAELSGTGARRIVGNDSMLAPALREGVCDGVVSGVACALPELILALYAERGDTNSIRFARASQLLGELVEHLNDFPIPWGLKWIAEARGIAPATFAQPVSEARAAQASALVAWVREWFGSAMVQLGVSDASFLR